MLYYDDSSQGVADRVCLGLIPSSENSWVTAVRALRCFISYHGILNLNVHHKFVSISTTLFQVPLFLTYIFSFLLMLQD